MQLCCVEAENIKREVQKNLYINNETKNKTRRSISHCSALVPAAGTVQYNHAGRSEGSTSLIAPAIGASSPGNSRMAARLALKIQLA
jgi:hypothetical protein